MKKRCQLWKEAEGLGRGKSCEYEEGREGLALEYPKKNMEIGVRHQLGTLIAGFQKEGKDYKSTIKSTRSKALSSPTHIRMRQNGMAKFLY